MHVPPFLQGLASQSNGLKKSVLKVIQTSTGHARYLFGPLGPRPP